MRLFHNNVPNAFSHLIVVHFQIVSIVFYNKVPLDFSLVKCAHQKLQPFSVLLREPLALSVDFSSSMIKESIPLHRALTEET